MVRERAERMAEPAARELGEVPQRHERQMLRLI
jgi:hypothetical protein